MASTATKWSITGSRGIPTSWIVSLIAPPCSSGSASIKRKSKLRGKSLSPERSRWREVTNGRRTQSTGTAAGIRFATSSAAHASGWAVGHGPESQARTYAARQQARRHDCHGCIARHRDTHRLWHFYAGKRTACQRAADEGETARSGNGHG